MKAPKILFNLKSDLDDCLDIWATKEDTLESVRAINEDLADYGMSNPVSLETCQKCSLLKEMSDGTALYKVALSGDTVTLKRDRCDSRVWNSVEE